MKTKIVLALCALAVALCLVGCTAQTDLPGTAWKSSKVPFLERMFTGTQATFDGAKLFFLKNGVLTLEVTATDNSQTPPETDTNNFNGTWAANANQLTYNIIMNLMGYQHRGTTTVKIENGKMTWLNDDGSVYMEWEQVTK